MIPYTSNNAWRKMHKVNDDLVVGCFCCHTSDVCRFYGTQKTIKRRYASRDGEVVSEWRYVAGQPCTGGGGGMAGVLHVSTASTLYMLFLMVLTTTMKYKVAESRSTDVYLQLSAPKQRVDHCSGV